MIYQVIKHEYDSDDGHYDSDPVDDIVYEREADAILVRNGLNKYSVFENNMRVRKEIAYMEEKRSDPEFVEPQRGRDKHGCLKPPPYLSKAYVEAYTAKYLFVGDPTDEEALSRFNTYQGPTMTYFTIEKLRFFK